MDKFVGSFVKNSTSKRGKDLINFVKNKFSSKKSKSRTSIKRGKNQVLLKKILSPTA
jgi:hypothetical protein